jgi:CRISPR-associated protein Cmr4
MSTHLALVHAMSPLHAGTGQAVGTIDLPIARERPTGIPLLPGSSLKGALRARGSDPALTRDAFGPETTNASDHSGSVQFSDAHLVLLPVRSVAGTYAWVTSRYLLQRFARTAREARVPFPPLPAAPAKDGCVVAAEDLVVRVGQQAKVVLEDLDFLAAIERTGPLAACADRFGELLFPRGSADWEYWRASFRSRLCLIGDDTMSFLLDYATEVTARVRLAEATKTVAQGALWYEETLPAETVLAALVLATGVQGGGRTERTAEDLAAYVAAIARDKLIQLGGKSTVGRGSCVVRLVGGGA